MERDKGAAPFMTGRAVRVAVFLEHDVSVGGGFQQAYSVAECLARNPIDGAEFVFFVLSRHNHEILNARGIENVWIRQTPARIAARAFRKFLRLGFGVIIPFQGRIDGILTRHKIDIVYFLGPSVYSMGLRKHPFIITVWDQCHRDWVEFPEVRNDMEFESREYLYRNVLPKAAAVLVDAASSRKNMRARYGLDLSRVKTAAFFPMPDISDEPEPDIRAKYSITNPFIFYPAQFWPHKNHVYILDAMSLMKTRQLCAVFTGSDYGNKRKVMEYAARLGLSDRCRFPGFVPRAELTAFYRNAAALVMPTYFGPTNIPPLEAFYHGCPVCYSDLPGLREQTGDAAFLMDLDSPASLAAILELILSGDSSVSDKIARGCGILKRYAPERYMQTIAGILKSYQKTSRCGGSASDD